jgi:hypothetical protein
LSQSPCKYEIACEYRHLAKILKQKEGSKVEPGRIGVPAAGGGAGAEYLIFDFLLQINIEGSDVETEICLNSLSSANRGPNGRGKQLLYM